ncbi:four helix bundle protein [archaeon]|nr:four helix bundle protein [archaeon]
MQDFRNLLIWKKSINLCEQIYLVTKNFPKEETYGLTNQIRRASISISSNIAEGCGRKTNKDFCNFLYIASGSLKEIECQLIIAQKLNYISLEILNKLIYETTEIGKMISGFIKSLQNSG